MDSLIRSNSLAGSLHLVTLASLVAAYAAWPNAHTHATRKAYRYQIAGPSSNLAHPEQEILGVCTTQGSSGISPGKCTTEPNFMFPKPVFQLNVIYACMAFFLFTSGAHFWYASSPKYFAHIQEGWNPYRWIEYAISASLMTIILGLVDGANDATLLLVLAVMTGAMQFCGYTTESILKVPGLVNMSAVWGASVTGWLLFVGLWYALISSFASQVKDVDTKFKGLNQPAPDDTKPIKVPSWIYIVIGIQLFNYFGFGLVQYKHIQARLKGSVNYIGFEHAYIGLSFSAKLGLAAGVAYGLLFRVKDCTS